MCQTKQDAELLRSLRREIGAPSRPASARAGADGNTGGGSRGGGAYGADGRGGPGPSRRMVGSSGGVNDLSSMGLLRGALLSEPLGNGGRDVVLARRDVWSFGAASLWRVSHGCCFAAECSCVENHSFAKPFALTAVARAATQLGRKAPLLFSPESIHKKISLSYAHGVLTLLEARFAFT